MKNKGWKHELFAGPNNNALIQSQGFQTGNPIILKGVFQKPQEPRKFVGTPQA